MPPCVLAVASLGRPAHRRFSAPPDVQELLQMGSFSTASDACCACGALQSAAVIPHPSVDYEPGSLFDLDTRTNPLAACGWGACARGVDWGVSAYSPPTEFCSTW